MRVAANPTTGVLIRERKGKLGQRHRNVAKKEGSMEVTSQVI